MRRPNTKTISLMNLKYLLSFVVITLLTNIMPCQGQNLIVSDSLLMQLNNTRNKDKQLKLLKELSDETGKWDINQSNSYARRGLELAQSMQRDSSEAQFITIIAHNEYFLGNYMESLSLYLSSLELYEKMADIKGIIGVNVNLGAIYDRLGDEERSLEFYKNALLELNSNGQHIVLEHPEFKTVLFNNIASVYNRMGDTGRYL